MIDGPWIRRLRGHNRGVAAMVAWWDWAMTTRPDFTGPLALAQSKRLASIIVRKIGGLPPLRAEDRAAIASALSEVPVLEMTE